MEYKQNINRINNNAANVAACEQNSKQRTEYNCKMADKQNLLKVKKKCIAFETASLWECNAVETVFTAHIKLSFGLPSM